MSSKHGKHIFTDALLSGSAESFFLLMQNFVTQSTPTYCSVASLAMILNSTRATHINRMSQNKLLECTATARICEAGVTLSELHILCKHHGLYSSCHEAMGTLGEFREHIKFCCSTHGLYIIINYSRSTLGQQGGGHFSPVGAYDVEYDMVLILDVARNKYPPCWVPLVLLWTSMCTIDKRSGRARGYVILNV